MGEEKKDCSILVRDGLFAEHEIERLWTTVDVARAEESARPFSFASSFENGRICAPDAAALIFDRCRPFLPECDHLFFAVVSPGQLFGLHTDTGSVFDDDAREYSKFTVLLFLDESGRDFEGGQTCFFPVNEREVRVRPVRNRLLAFDIDLFHCGEQVRSGTKRWVGTEFVYRRVLFRSSSSSSSSSSS
jgi:hypothetical protein